jgi:hypothetical protein
VLASRKMRGRRGAHCVRHRRGLRPGACSATLHVIGKLGAVSTVSQTVGMGASEIHPFPDEPARCRIECVQRQ